MARASDATRRCRAIVEERREPEPFPGLARSTGGVWQRGPGCPCSAVSEGAVDEGRELALRLCRVMTTQVGVEFCPTGITGLSGAEQRPATIGRIALRQTVEITLAAGVVGADKRRCAEAGRTLAVGLEAAIGACHKLLTASETSRIGAVAGRAAARTGFTTRPAPWGKPGLCAGARVRTCAAVRVAGRAGITSRAPRAVEQEDPTGVVRDCGAAILTTPLGALAIRVRARRSGVWPEPTGILACHDAVGGAAAPGVGATERCG